MYYYKINIHSKTQGKNCSWPGSRLCLKKKLKSFSWFKHLKSKNAKKPFWKIFKEKSIQLIENGGWHFTNIKSPENLEKKFLNFLHHQEFEASGLKLDNIKEMVKNKKIIYDLDIDQKNYKWKGTKSLNKVPLSTMPDYLYNNYKKYSNWLEI